MQCRTDHCAISMTACTSASKRAFFMLEKTVIRMLFYIVLSVFNYFSYFSKGFRLVLIQYSSSSSIIQFSGFMS